jgi:hypothetical protein
MPSIFYVVETDDQGLEIWDNNRGTDNNDTAFAVLQTREDGFIVVGVPYHMDGSSDIYGHNL